MGICVSSQTIETTVGGIGWSYTGKIIHVDGKLQEFRLPIKAGHILSQNPNCFLCNSESMYLDSCMTQVPDKEELQLGQIYILLPLSLSQTPLSLSDLCNLAVKANKALTDHEMKVKIPQGKIPSPFSGGHGVPTRSQGSCKIPVDFDVTQFGSEMDRGNRGIGH